MLGDVEATSEKQNFKVVVDGGYFTDAKLHFSIETDGTWRFSAQWLRARRADFLSLALRRKRSRRAACRQPAARGPARNGAGSLASQWFSSVRHALRVEIAARPSRGD